MGSVVVRLIGELEDIKYVIERLRAIFGEDVWFSLPLLNIRDPGFRVYANLKTPAVKEDEAKKRGRT